jgi:hypothetical protein
MGLLEDYGADDDPLAFLANHGSESERIVRALHDALEVDGQRTAEQLRGATPLRVSDEHYLLGILPLLRECPDIEVRGGVTVDRDTALKGGLLTWRRSDEEQLVATDELKRRVVQDGVDEAWDRDSRSHGAEGLARQSIGLYCGLASRPPLHPEEFRLDHTRVGKRIALGERDWERVREGILQTLPGFETDPRYVIAIDAPAQRGLAGGGGVES